MGYLLIRVDGVALEKFVNMAISRGMYLWDIALQSDESLLIKVRVSSFKALRHIAKKVGCHISIEEKRGFPFFMAYLLKRKMLLAGAFTFLITLYLLSSFVWFIEIQGAKNIPKQTLLLSLKQVGLDKGTPKWEIKTNEIENKLGKKVPELAWVGIKIKGTKAIVEIVEKKLPDKEQQTKEPAHILAAKSGVIKEILVMTGEAVVKEGQLVKKGQVLISGIIMPTVPQEQNPLTSEQQEEPISEPKYVHAKGIVKARVWYQVIGDTKIVQTKYEPTGRTVSNLRIKIGAKEIILKGPKNIDFKHYKKEEKFTKFIGWRNIEFPVEVISTTYFETKEIRLNVGYKKAKQLAIGAAQLNINKKLPSNAEVIRKKIEEVKVDDPNRVRFKVTVEAVENIGKVRYIRKDNLD